MQICPRARHNFKDLKHYNQSSKMSGRRHMYWVVSLYLAVMWLCAHGAMTACPWEEPGLSKWSDPNTWESGSVPGQNAEVFVKKRVLLDMQPESLGNLTIQAGAALIWGNVPNLTLRATYIRVFGEFHLGSDTCRFQHKANIKLYGKPDSKYLTEPLGRKYLGVESGGVLELHGQDKMSWTKLAHTIPALSSGIPCSYLYDHKATPLSLETVDGMHVVIWKPDGRLYDFQVFDFSDWDLLPKFVNISNGLILAASVRRNLGTPTESFYTAMESLGAKLIRSVGTLQNYAFIVRKGDTTSIGEKLADMTVADTGYLHLPDHNRDLDFSVTSVGVDVDFRVMNGDVAFPIISVAHDVSSWKPGDQILVTSTDYDWRQAEVRSVVQCNVCNKNQIKLDTPFLNMHYGEVTLNVDERAEVALLSRNILIEGELESSCYGNQTLCDLFGRDTYGGHVKALRGATVHVQGVELYHLGQQAFLSAYPFHFHMMDDASGMWFRNNSIHHSLSRCVTIHATDNVKVSDNVCFDHLGHGYFLEDSVEQNNVIDRNLGVGTQHGALLMSEKKSQWCEAVGLQSYCDGLATFWITHPNNEFTNNVAAGSETFGYFFVFADKPIGESNMKTPAYSPKFTPIKRFYNNAAHSNVMAGIFFDSRLSTGEYHQGNYIPENGVIPCRPNYDPRYPPVESGNRTWSIMERLNLFKNMKQNAWIKPGNIRVIKSSFADSLRGLGGGTNGMNTGGEVKDSVFVGRSDNKGMPESWTDSSHPDKPTFNFDHSLAGVPYESITGVEFYQGPVFVDNCHFDRYAHDWWADNWEQLYGVRGVSPGGAVTWHRTSTYPTTPFSEFSRLKFGFCDNINGQNWVYHGNSSMYRWEAKDGAMQATLRDSDGSLTGRAGTQLVPNRPFFTGPECRYHDNWGMTACPYRYIQMEILGDDGVLTANLKTKYPIIVRRDDTPTDAFVLEGTIQNTHLLRTHKSYTVSFNKTLGTVPTFFRIECYGVEAGDVVRVALCLPKDTTDFEIRVNYPPLNPVWATSLQQLDGDTVGNMVFWDSIHGLLYFKFLTDQVRQDKTEACSGGQCVRFNIWRRNGGNGPADCSGYANPPFTDNAPTPSVPEPKPCPGPASAEGLGAVVPAEIVKASPVPVVCKQLDPEIGRLTPAYLGCFADKPWDIQDLSELLQELPKAMTRKLCTDRCYRRGFKYAGLQVSKRCACGNSYGRYGPATYPCDEPCSGISTQTCGSANKKSVEVWSTGLV